MAYYSWLVDFELAHNRWDIVIHQLVPSSLGTYNFGLVMGVLFLCAPVHVHEWTSD